MNVTIFENSYEWLFANRGHERAWSLGRWKRTIEPGDSLYFRWEGRIVAVATCSRVTLTASGRFSCWQ